MDKKEATIKYLLRIADSSLILGQRLGEWCGHGPVLEEDIAMTNTALDLIGQSRFLYTYVAEIRGKGESEDDIAFLRDTDEYYNLLMVEQENGDFAKTVARQYLFSAFIVPFYEALMTSKDEQLMAFAHKSIKEAYYHLKHSRDWILRLGDGTEESHNRMQKGLKEIWEWTGELFTMDEVDAIVIEAGIGVDLKNIQERWNAEVDATLNEATLTRPTDDYMQEGGKTGNHTEKLGFMLAEMQWLQRAYPGAEW
jgi:ring-1,2-phenylacetyl-CoA epoxidase subunit PaaC